ncbi:MAG: prenyltransferase/squalene oxidase repeat-containing protein [Sedimenticola sp.]
MNKDTIHNQIENGILYLYSSLSSQGSWSSFESSRGMSDVWVTGYVASEVGSLSLNAETKKIIVEFLVSNQLQDGGWGYKTGFPGDSDSTATVLLALIALTGKRQPKDIIDQGLKFLDQHFAIDHSGYGTFRLDVVRKILSSNDATCHIGWTNPHLDVTLNALQAILKSKRSGYSSYILDTFNQALLADSAWEAYWWTTNTVCISKAADILSSIHHQKLRALLLKECMRLVDCVTESGGWSTDISSSECSFTTALAIRSLLAFPQRFDMNIESGVDYLLNCQLSDGSWSSGPILAIPPPALTTRYSVKHWRIDQPGFPNVLSDGSRAIVTAVVLQTLFLVAQCYFNKSLKIEL